MSFSSFTNSAKSAAQFSQEISKITKLASEINTTFNTEESKREFLNMIKTLFKQIYDLIKSQLTIIANSNMFTSIQKEWNRRFMDSITSLIILIAVLFGAGGVFNKGGNLNKTKSKKQSKTRKHKKTRFYR
jgi:Co/Zn/Cd efflux system component